MYAYTQVALYGKDFITAAKDTFDLFEHKGFAMIINDNLTGVVIFVGVVICAIISTVAAGIPLYFANQALWGTATGNVVIYFFVFFFIAYFISCVMLIQLQSAVCTTFVVWAEDPDALQTNRPAEYQEIEASRLAFVN